MRAEEIATKAAELVNGPRNHTHGDKHINFTKIARLWNAYLANREQLELTAVDVGQMMALLKMARIQSGTMEAEHFIDETGYVICAGEIALGRAGNEHG